MRLKKLLLWLGLAILALALLAWHVDHHYLPRARPGIPQAGSPAAALLASDEFPVALWIPHPHQNLGFLRRAIGGGGGGLRAVGRLAGLPSPALPTFGPLVVPPATEMAVASDEGGERYAVVAAVHPAFAWFARLAGRLAGNPWLEGGEIYVEGRRTQVTWSGDLWIVASPELPRAVSESLPESRRSEGSAEAALAVIRLRQAVHPLPSGRYRLVSRGRALEIVSQGAGEPAPEVGGLLPGFDQLGLADLGVFLLAYTGRTEALGEPAQALAYFASPDADSQELPRLAALHEPGGDRRSLPGEGLLELGDRRVREAEVAGWSIAAIDEADLERAEVLAPRLEALRSPAGGAGVAWALWLDLEAGLSEVSRIADILDQLPIVPERRLERWRDAAEILRPLSRHYSLVTAVVTDERAFRLRLEPRADVEA